jgi:F-type H+-transporting ATPase subunit b
MGGLGINPWIFGSQLITFLIVWFVLQRWAFPFMTKMLNDRARTIQEGLENAEKTRQELAQVQAQVAQMREEARQESQRTLAAANQSAQKLRSDIEAQANNRAQDILVQAQKNTEQLVSQAKSELRGQVADLAIKAAESVIGTSLDNDTNRKLVGDVVAQSKELS